MSDGQTNVLVFGNRGQVGGEVSRLLLADGYSFIGVDREECDLCREQSILELINATNPGAIVNAAAYTAVDRAESEPLMAELINSTAPKVMAREAQARKIPLIHYSTDYVFDGKKQEPWVEDDMPAPLNIYGATKLAGERGVLSVCRTAFVFRTSWVYGAEGINFLRTMLRLGQEKDELSIVADQLGAPTWSRSLADLTVSLLKRLRVGEHLDLDAVTKNAGLYHSTCGGATSWYEFACAIFRMARARGIDVKVSRVIPISSEQYPGPAERPRYSVLSNMKLKRQLGYELPQWSDALSAVIKEIPCASPMPSETR